MKMWKKFKRRNRVQKQVQIYTTKIKRYQIFGVNQLLITKLPYLFSSYTNGSQRTILDTLKYDNFKIKCKTRHYLYVKQKFCE